MTVTFTVTIENKIGDERHETLTACTYWQPFVAACVDSAPPARLWRTLACEIDDLLPTHPDTSSLSPETHTKFTCNVTNTYSLHQKADSNEDIIFQELMYYLIYNLQKVENYRHTHKYQNIVCVFHNDNVITGKQ